MELDLSLVTTARRALRALLPGPDARRQQSRTEACVRDEASSGAPNKPDPAIGRRLGVVPRTFPTPSDLEANNYLVRYANQVTSQDGEDGVLAEIFSRLGISAGWCVEFGAWDGKFHSNTWDLIHNRNWKAVCIEAHTPAFNDLKASCEGLADVYCYNEYIEIEGGNSLESILSRTPIPQNFDFISIDIDGNDYFIWRSLEHYRPKVVLIEFNPFIPVDVSFAKINRGQVRASASLLALCELGKTKGYELVCVIGNNAVFVVKEHFVLFALPDNRPAAMFRSHLETKLFQGYDGTLFLAGNRKLVWRWEYNRQGMLDHVEVQDGDIQVLPSGLRTFRPRMSYRNDFLEEKAGKMDVARMPGNQLLQYRANVTSECGEDGILAHIFGKLGTTNKFCVDVGAYDGRTFSNTWSLLNQSGWSGLLVEKDRNAFLAMEARYRGNPAAKLLQAEIGTQGDTALEAVLKSHSVASTFDLLCIDVEGNDYNIWAALHSWTPRVVVVDFNPTIGNDVIFTQDDDAKVHEGASLRAFVELAKTKSYELAAVTNWNAIFVHASDFPGLGLPDNDIDQMYYAELETRIFQSLDCYLSTTGCDRLIRHNYVFDPEQLQPLPANVRAKPFMTDKLGEVRSTFFDRPWFPDTSTDRQAALL